MPNSVQYHYYICNRSCAICIDHKMLLKLLGKKSSPPPWFERWLLQLQEYQYHLGYISGQSRAADCLSRNPASVTDHDHAIDHYMQYITNNVQPKSFWLDGTWKVTQEDPILQKVKVPIISSKRIKSSALQTYFKLWHHLTTQDGLIPKDHCLVIPNCQQHDILKAAYKNHQRLTKTKSILRDANHKLRERARIRTHNHLFRKQTLNQLVKLGWPD